MGPDQEAKDTIRCALSSMTAGLFEKRWSKARCRSLRLLLQHEVKRAGRLSLKTRPREEIMMSVWYVLAMHIVCMNSFIQGGAGHFILIVCIYP
jgi:hypothetical protein